MAAMTISRAGPTKICKWLPHPSRFSKGGHDAACSNGCSLRLFLTYKYNGAEDLRNKLYSPFNADLDKMQTFVTANNMSNFFSGSALSAMKQSGDFYRMPKSLQQEVSALYDDEGQLQSNLGPIVELLERAVSRRVESIRSEQIDQQWALDASARIRAQEQVKSGISTLSSFTATHSGRSRAVDVRDPNHPVVSGPGGPELDINDWLTYPDSLAQVDSLFGNDDYLYFDARDMWYYRITRADLSRKGMTLKDFLEPIHETLMNNNHFKNSQSNEPEIMRRLTALKREIAERMNTPKRLGDLFD
jgi:hypothetical protein